MAVTTYDPATVDTSDIPGSGYAYDDPYVYPSHSNRIVSGKELAQLWAIASRGGRFVNVNDRGLGARAGTLDGIGREPYSQVLTKTDNFAIQTDMPSNMLILMNVSTTGKAVTLPNPRGVKLGWTVTVKKINSSTTNTISINRKNTETIDGRSANDVLTAQYSFATYISDGTNWNVVAANDYMSAVQATAVNFAATGNEKNAASLTLQPGEWEISALMVANNNGATCTSVVTSISANSADATGTVLGDSRMAQAGPNANTSSSASIPAFRVSVAAATTYYHLVLAAYSAGNPQYQTRMSARRLR